MSFLAVENFDVGTKLEVHDVTFVVCVLDTYCQVSSISGAQLTAGACMCAGWVLRN
jgi:hypothetical protein